MNEGHLFEWLNLERKRSELQEVPKDLDEQLIELFKEIKESGDDLRLKNCMSMFEKLYTIRLKKLCTHLLFRTAGHPMIRAGNLCPREKKMEDELMEIFVGGRKSIFTFLGLPWQPENSKCKIEFSKEALEEEEKNVEIINLDSLDDLKEES